MFLCSIHVGCYVTLKADASEMKLIPVLCIKSQCTLPTCVCVSCTLIYANFSIKLDWSHFLYLDDRFFVLYIVLYVVFTLPLYRASVK